jgi:membrane fusion protein, multidrug efflux system
MTPLLPKLIISKPSENYKSSFMQSNTMKYTLLVAALVSLAACGNHSASNAGGLNAKKDSLARLREQVASLEKEIAKLDTAAAKAEKAKLVSLATLAPAPFVHNIDLQGKVDPQNVSYASPRNGTGGLVKAIYVKKGDAVKKGQLLLKLDDALIKKSIDAQEIQLAYLKDIYERRMNLWKQSIGTEVEVISAKNNVDMAQKQLDLYKEQMALTNVYADVDGVADDVNIRVGELFTGVTANGTVQIRLVNTSQLKVVVQVPENYLEKVGVGKIMEINFPDLRKTLTAKIVVAGKVIDPISRSFYVEAHLSPDREIHPNQIALVRIKDYEVPNAIVIPVNTSQTDEKGKFVMVAVTENGKKIARKRSITTGEMYGDKLEVKSGLQAGDVLITDGFQSLYDGQLITTEI